MRFLKAMSIALALVVFSPLSLIANDSIFQLHGTVIDETGDGIDGAQLVLISPEHAAHNSGPWWVTIFVKHGLDLIKPIFGKVINR